MQRLLTYIVPAKKSPDSTLHPRNIHQGRYDLDTLCTHHAALKTFLTVNPRGEKTIDFSKADAVLALNHALLATYYGVLHWSIPTGYLCPPIPGRADYIHYLADLLVSHPVNTQHPVRVLDIGTGANLIYPIIGCKSYDWQFTASDIDPTSIKNAAVIITHNNCLKGKIDVRLQPDSRAFFNTVIHANEYYALSMCNPPFYASLKEAQVQNARKVKNLSKHAATKKPVRNFGGQQAELWCKGGELAFLKGMINESVSYATQVGWFTSLVSQEDNLRPLRVLLKKVQATQVCVIKMKQGQKVSRILAWRFSAV